MLKTPSPHRPDVDGLRAVAILGVLLFHAFPQWLPGGFVGVDVFFVISGFVVTHSLLRHPIRGWGDVLAFYARRARRLFPALALVLIACAALGWLLLPEARLAQLGKHILGSAGFVQNLLLWREAGYFDTSSNEKWLLHLWSLGIEEQFYWLLPLLMLGLSTWPRLQRWATPWGWGGLAALSLGTALWLSQTQPAAGFFLPVARFWEFLAGVMLAQHGFQRTAPTPAAAALAHPAHPLPSPTRAWAQAQPASRGHGWAAAAGLLGLGLAFWGLREAPWGPWHFPGPQAVWPVLCTALLIWGQRSWLNTRVLAAAPMQYVGRISYPLYLWHWPLLAYLNTLDPAHQWAHSRWAAVGLALALASLTHHALERPVQQRTRSAWPWWCLMLAVAALGGWLWKATPTAPAWAQTTQAEPPRWAGDALYRDDTCLQHPAVNPWQRRDFFCLGDPNRAPLALLGDSHANALSAGLMPAMPAQWLNLGGGGCMPFDGVDSGTEQSGLQCPAEIPTAFVKHLSRSAHIHTVLILLRGPLYLEGTGWGPAEADIRRWLSTQGVKAAHAQERADWFQAGMWRTLNAMAQGNKQVIWLLNTPEMGLNIDACLRPMWGSGWLAPAPVCEVSRTAFEARSARYRLLVQRTAAAWNAQRPSGSPAVRVLDPAEALCKADSCPLVLDGQTLYRDGDHLSEQGAQRLTRWLLPQLTP